MDRKLLRYGGEVGSINEGKKMTPKIKKLVTECVENGITSGYVRAHKGEGAPDEHTIKEHIFDAIMKNFSDWFEFYEDEEG